MLLKRTYFAMQKPYQKTSLKICLAFKTNFRRFQKVIPKVTSAVFIMFI